MDENDDASGGPWLMVLTEHERDDVRVRAWGELDAARAGELRRELERIASGLARSALVTVDVSRLTFIDSAGIRALEDGRRVVRRGDGRFRLIASEALRRLLELSGKTELLVDN